jgi:hypothetical protein
MISREIFADETPLSNGERLAQYRRKRDYWRDEQWWLLTHGEDDGVVMDDVRLVATGKWLPAFLRRQAG